MIYSDIPQETIRRLPLYLRRIDQLIKSDQEHVSSQDLARDLRMNPAQIRKDLAYFGDFGTRGVGYDAERLAREIRSILNLDHTWNMALVGVGNIGSALLTYPGFERRGFKVRVAFDKREELIGTEVGGVTVEDEARLEQSVTESGSKLGIVAVPSHSAQEVAQRLVKANVKGILNFAPTILNVSDGVRVTYVDITTELCQMVYYFQE